MQFYVDNNFRVTIRMAPLLLFMAHGIDIPVLVSISFLFHLEINNRPKGYYEEFLKGFLLDTKGPKSLLDQLAYLKMKDGSLLFSEDGNGRLYRIEYLEKQSKMMPIISHARISEIDMTLFFALVLLENFILDLNF